MALRAIKIFFIASIGLILVSAQSDGRYRPSGDDGRYHGSNDGKYTGTDSKYVQTKDKIGGFGSQFGVVNIGGARPKTKATARPPPPAPAPPQVPLAVQPSPPIFIIDTRSNADNSPSGEPTIKILRQEQEETADGYRYLYETENGIVAEESGQIEKTEDGEDAIRTTGFYQYIGDDGKQYRVDYTADANGFNAKGDHLPTPPPIPPEIQELLNNLATKQPDSA